MAIAMTVSKAASIGHGVRVRDDSWTRRRLGWPGLAVLMLALAGAIVWLVATEEAAGPAVIPRGPYVGALEEVPPAEGPPRDAGPAQFGFPTGARAADPTGRDAFYDPQRTGSEARYPTSGDAGLPAPFQAFVRTARVGEGPGEPAIGTACEVRVLPVDRPPFNCVARVVCAGEVLYPNEAQTTGFLACEIDEGVVRGASDRDESDGDPQLELSIADGRAEVEREGRRVRVVWDAPAAR